MKKNILIILLALITFVHAAGITIGPNARVSFGNVNVNVYGNLKNTLVKEDGKEKLGLITVLPTSKVSFVGSAQDTVTNIYTFPNVVMNKPSGNVLIANNTNSFVLTNNISFTKGNVITGTSTFELGTTATVSGESTNGYIVGTTKAARSVGTSTNTFGGIGYSINNTGSDLGTVTVYRYTGDGSEEVLYGSEGIWRKWDVQTSNAFSGTRQVTTSWLSNEDNGNVLADLKVWKYETAKSAGNDADSGIRKLKIDSKTASKRLDREIPSEYGEEIIVEEEQPKTLGWVEVDGAVFNTASSPRTATYTVDAATAYTINDVANAFEDGSGTENNPYQIATLDQLNAVRYYPTACFIQIADIDASATTGWNSGSGWEPIGSSGSQFTGKYNGQGYDITGLYINRSALSYIGLFGYANGSAVSNVELYNVDITGGNYTGGLIGYQTGSASVENCMSDGTVAGVSYVGGLVGYIRVGSSINNSLSRGEVSANSYLGGLIGRIYSDCDVLNSYSQADVIRNSGQTSTIIGGFIGQNYSGSIINCYSTGSVTYEDVSAPTDKGFAGSIYNDGMYYSMAGNFWNTETSGQLTTSGTATGITKNEMRTLSIFTDATWDFQDESVNGESDIWGINATENSGYPFLSWEGLTHNPSPFAGGIGTSDEPFLVANLTQLDAVRNFLSYYFLQTADIDASPTTGWNSGAGWEPLGNSTTKFTGNYDGQDHYIDGLYLNRTTLYNGLFGYTTGSSLSNINLTNVDFTSTSSYLGGLAGYNYLSSSIYNCSCQGSITGAGYLGGLVGYNLTSSTIDNCYTDCNIIGTYYVGGMVGRNYTTSTVTNSFSKGTVEGTYYIGGFAGYNTTTGLIENCYSITEVFRTSGDTHTQQGGFIGYNYSGKIKKCYSTGSITYIDATNPTNRGFMGYVYNDGINYEMTGNFWNTETSGQSSSYYAGDAVGITSAQMRTQSTFTDAGWDFVGESVNGDDDYWNIHTSINSGFPYLNWEYRVPVETPANMALTVSGTDVIITWDAVTGAADYFVYSSEDPYGTFTLDETGVFNGTEWTGPLTGTKMFYYVVATNDTKVIMARKINSGNISE